MDLRRLEYFIKVVETSSFSRAAVALHLSQSNLSRQIAALEANVGQPLLVRHGRGASPTEAGVLLHENALDILNKVQATRDALLDLKGSLRGHVSVGLPSLVAQLKGAQLAERFREKFPQSVLTITEGMSTQLREWLVDARLDMALMFDPAPAPQLNYAVLAREPLVLVAPGGRRKRLPDCVALTDLPSYPMILTRAPNAVRRLLDSVLKPLQIELDVVAESGAVRTMLSMVSRGVGCTILPQSALGVHLDAGALQHAQIGPPTIWNRLVIAVPRARPSNRLLSAAASLLRELYEADASIAVQG